MPASYISFDLEPESDNVAVTNDDGEKPSDSGSFYVEVLYDFEAVNADELELRKGDRILVTKMDDNGWWEGLCFFPFLLSMITAMSVFT